MTRTLVSTRRRVPPERLDTYASAWQRLKDAVVVRRARAWLFRNTRRPDMFLEFIEFSGPDRSIDDPVIAAAREALDAAGPGEAEEWEEV